ncbi:MAG: (2Fe-2S)-binding protein [Spirochaetaceae bacterium]|nr:(2Fe-2S)-binding protein [Spirochaetaceae bacterium]
MKEFRSEKPIDLSINGEIRSVLVRPGDTLLKVLRQNLGMTGTKLGCENGDCGACTVQRDGIPIKSCCTLVADVSDSEITTIEGLRGTPIQDAFVNEYGFQCGFCTPGLMMNAEALVRTVPDADNEIIREWLESNICRCTGYETIELSVKRALAEGQEN